jgi:Ca2+-transporting ATPase
MSAAASIPPLHSAPLAGTDTYPRGLTAAEAKRRLDRDGLNELPRSGRRSLFAIIVEVMREPMFLLLSAAAILYLLLGDVPQALVLCASVLIVIAVTVHQAGKSERALEALRDLSSPRAAVIRDGELVRIAARELVVGDIVMLGEGDRMPADARVLACHDLRADESLLTGESMSVRKRISSGAERTADPGTADSAWLYSGTLIVGGHATAEVSAIGAQTAVGRIGRALGEMAVERSPMQHEVDRAVIVFAVIGLGLCTAVTGMYLAFRGGWVDALLAGITLAIANIPEEFPVVLTIFLALGAWRLARHHVLTRRAPAIETLGAISVLCADKTGTLTENRMQVFALRSAADRWSARPTAEVIPAAFDELLRYAALASELTPFDPMEKAILATRSAWTDTRDCWRLVEEYPLTSELLAHTHVWHAGDRFVVACKGAPEAVAELCALSADRKADLLADVVELARSGLRVIAVAKADCAIGSDLPVSQRGFAFQLLGLIGLADPVRAGVRAAVAEAGAAGVRTIMLTGDYAETARSVADAVGLRNAETALAGSEIAALGDERLRECVATHNVYTRVAPEQKLRLVRALIAGGEIVAMTGDGVNDAPALKAAHVGIAMGGRGSDVAREASSIVLLDDNFVSIVQAIRLGRTIYDNIERALRYVLAVHVPITGIALLPLLVGGPLVFWPIHIVFLELVIDPACAVVFEREPASPDVMLRPPRGPKSRLLSVPMLASSLMEGLAALAASMLVYYTAWHYGLANALVASLTFASIVAGNVALIAVNRSTKSLRGALRLSNAAFWWTVGLACTALAVSLYAPPVSQLFRFASPPVHLLGIAVTTPLLMVAAATILRSLLRTGNVV